MQGFEQLFLRAIADLKETASVKVARDLLDRLQPQPVCLPIRRHVFEAIAVVRVFEKPLVDPRQNRDSCALRRDRSCGRYARRSASMSRASSSAEKANRRNIVNAIEDHFRVVRASQNFCWSSVLKPG